MPQRFLRPGITTSERWNALDWQAQSFYIRLITLVDDYGRYDAHPLLLKSHVFPYNPEINCEQLTTLANKCCQAGMLVLYECDGKKYLQLTRWQERARSNSRYPDPSDNKCKQLLANDNNCSPPSPSSAPAPQPSPSTITPAPAQPPTAVPPNEPPAKKVDELPENKTPPAKTKPGKPKQPKVAEDSPAAKKFRILHVQFIARWVEDFHQTFGFDYKFQSGKDAHSVAELIRIKDQTLDSLLATAKAAWVGKGFLAEQSRTICGFNSKFNEIMVQFGATKPSAKPWDF